MFQITDRELKELEKDLQVFAKRAYPFATKNTLNRAAFNARQYAQENIGREFTERNKWTRQSIRVEQTKTLNIRSQMSVFGSTLDYMEKQEFGGVTTATGEHGVTIPTAYAAGQKGQQPRTRMPRKANRMDNIILSKRKRRAKTRKQALVFAVQDAVTSGNRHVFLDLGRRQGIFRVVGGRKGFKRGWPKGARLEMVQDMTRKSTPVPRTPTIAPAHQQAAQDIPELYAQALRYQAKRQGLFVS